MKGAPVGAVPASVVLCVAGLGVTSDFTVVVVRIGGKLEGCDCTVARVTALVDGADS